MSDPIFPEKLLDWAGHRSGGVRKLFHHGTARPSGDLIRTSLLERLETWVSDFLERKPSTPRVVLLVGGPGNGKTEAIESCIRRIDEVGSLQGKLVAAFSHEFAAGTGRPVPRLASVDVGAMSSDKKFELVIVQDASVEDPALANKTPPQLLLMDLERYALSSSDAVYLACVNRGVLDDAFSAAIDSNRDDARKFLAQVIRAVGLTSDAPSCWPLNGYSHVAIWPMDVESLLVSTSQGGDSPAQSLLQIATKADYWPVDSSCPAGNSCPYCTSRAWLDDDKGRAGLLKLLRWYELVSGKRWSFRDLGSLLSFLLAGFQGSEGGGVTSPCESAAKLLALDSDPAKRRTPQGNQAIYLLVSALYQHALFGMWPQFPARALRKDIRDLKLEQDSTLVGLQHFLSGQRRRSLPSTLERQLENLCALMDPAIADPDEDVQVSSRRAIKLREIDARFSQSVFEGLAFIGPFRVLAPLEVELLKRLARADQELSDAEIRNRRPVAAARVQLQVREFACRLVRRSLGARSGAARDASILEQFEHVIRGDSELIRRVVKQVETLLNTQDNFTTSLNTTFGEPSPPESRWATLTTTKQRVRRQDHASLGRPPATLLFLMVGNQATRQSVPLTFELFKAVSELGQGLLPAVLPRAVVALLDTTRARLSGMIVRDEELLEGAEMRIGLRSETIVREAGRFVVQRETTS